NQLIRCAFLYFRTMDEKIKGLIEDSITVKTLVLNDETLRKKIAEAAQKITEVFRNGSRVYFAGNGGSAADAQHLAAEFTGRYYKDREPLPAEALHVNT